MLEKIKGNKAVWFLIKAITLYLLWHLIYKFYLAPQGIIDKFIINQIIKLSGAIIHFFGFPTIQNAPTDSIRVFGIDGSTGLWIGDPCNGLALFALFSLFIIAYPGNYKDKLWYIPLGILTIHILNSIRVIALTLIYHYWPNGLEFSHTYIFTTLMYGYIFLLWMIWANKYGATTENLKP